MLSKWHGKLPYVYEITKSNGKIYPLETPSVRLQTQHHIKLILFYIYFNMSLLESVAPLLCKFKLKLSGD